MSGFELRPLSLGELLDRAFLLYRRNFALFAGIMAVPACLILPLQSYLFHARGIPFFRIHSSAGFRGMGPVVSFVEWNLYAFAQAATTYAVSDIYFGRGISIARAYAQTLRRSWKVLAVYWNVWFRMLALILIGGIPLIFAFALAFAALGGTQTDPRSPAMFAAGSLLFVSAALIAFLFCVRYFVALPVALLEKAEPRAAIRRSVALTKGRRWQAFAGVFLGLVVTYATASLCQGPFYFLMSIWKLKGQQPAWLVFSFAVSNTAGMVLAAPIAMIVPVLLYYDFKVRKEAFDLHQMMDSLPEPDPAASATIVRA